MVDRFDGHFKRELYGAFVKHEDYISRVRELEAELLEARQAVFREGIAAEEYKAENAEPPRPASSPTPRTTLPDVINLRDVLDKKGE